MHADDEGTPEGAGRAIESLLARRDLFLVLGPDLSALTHPTAHLTRQARVLQFTSALSSRITGLGKPWLFRLRPHNGYRATVAARFIAGVGFRRLGIVYLNNELGQDGRDNAERVLARAGIAPVFARPIAGAHENVEPLVGAVRAAEADALLYWGTQPAGAALLRALRAGGWVGKFLSNTMDDIFLAMAGAAAEGAVGFDCFASSDPDGRIQQFSRPFRDRWEKEPDAHAASNYDALMLLRAAVAAVGPDRDAVRAHLAGGPTFAGVAHTYRFDSAGELEGWATVSEIRDGRAIFQEKITDSVGA